MIEIGSRVLWKNSTPKVGITKASETVHGIRGAWVSEESVVVENNEVTEFRVTMRVSFVLD